MLNYLATFVKTKPYKHLNNHENEIFYTLFGLDAHCEPSG